MAPLETATFIDALVTSNPDGAADQRSTSDDHHRLVKAVLKRTFPMLAAAVSASAAALTFCNDLSASAQAQLNALREGSATAANAVNSRFSNSASFAVSAGFATSAGFANTASLASNAVLATTALTANSASFAVLAGFAQSASAAVTAANLNLVPAGSFARLDLEQDFTRGVGSRVVAAVDNTTITPNCTDGNVHRVVLGGNRTMGVPSSARSGQVLILIIRQDNTGGRTLTWNPIYRFAGGTEPILTTAPNAVDVFAFVHDNTSNVWLQGGLNVS